MLFIFFGSVLAGKSVQVFVSTRDV